MSGTKHTIAPGECLNSLVAEFGRSVDDIRELEGNEELMEKCPRSGCFNPGDEVYIPQPNGEFTINDGEELELVKRVLNLRCSSLILTLIAYTV